MKKSILIILILFTNIFFLINTSSAEPKTYAQAICIYDENFDKILYEKNSHQQLYPASTTKVLTALVVLENFSNLDEEIEIKKQHIEQVPPTYAISDFREHQKYSIYELLNLLLIPSNNDAAYALAQYTVNKSNNYNDDYDKFMSDIDTFANLMNKKCQDIGAKNSHFVNPNGIHSENQYTTAYDLVLIAKEAHKHPKISEIVSKESYYINNQRFYTTNHLLLKSSKTHYEGVTGLKTGYTTPAGYCMIATAEKNDRKLIVSLLNSPSIQIGENSRESDLKRCFDYGFGEYKPSTLISQNQEITEIDVFTGKLHTEKLKLRAKEPLNMILRNNDDLDYLSNITISKKTAPIEQGEVIGNIEVIKNGHVQNIDLIAEKRVSFSKITISILTIALIFILIILKSHLSKQKRTKLIK